MKKVWKAITFSYDDGVTQDQRLIEMFNRYGLKATFNINSGLLGKPGSLLCEEVTVAHVKPRPEEIGMDHTDEKRLLYTCILAAVRKVYLEKCLAAIAGEDV